MKLRKVLSAVIVVAMLTQSGAVFADTADVWEVSSNTYAELFADTSKYYSMDNTTEMTYSGSYKAESGQTKNSVNFTGGYATISSFPLTDSFTLSAWIKPTALASWERLFDFGSDTNNYIFFTVNNGAGYPRLAVKSNGGNEQLITSSKMLDKDVWSYVTVTLGNNTAKMYINGEEVASGTINIAMSALSGSTKNYIAKSQYAADATYKGNVDEIEIYNYAMTAEEIAERMSATSAKPSLFEKPEVKVGVGEIPVLPSLLEVTYENSMKAKTVVNWGTLEAYTQRGEYTVTGTTEIAGTEYEVEAKVTVTSDLIDENYSGTVGLNYVNNAGSRFAEAIYNIYSENAEELTLKLGVYNENGDLLGEEITDFTPSAEGVKITSKLNLSKYIGNVTVKSAIYKKASGDAITDVKERNITLTGSFADPANVTLEKNSVFEKSEQVGLDYILSIDVDKLLAPSYEMHGQTPPNNATRYGGWERKSANSWVEGGGAETYTLAGHSLGHWMSAAAVFYRDTGDERVLAKLNYAVEKLDELQKTTGSGYVGGCGEACFTKLFGGNASSWADGYWVPWYGVHKIYQGLLDAYDYTGNTTAFEVLKKFSDWAVDGTEGLTDTQMQTMLNVEYGGMNEIFARMYEITEEDKYLTAARRFTHDSILNPLINNTDSLTGLHANTQIPKIVGAAEIYEQDADTYANYKKASEVFRNFVVNNRSYAIGGNSIAEHFEAQGAESLGVKTCESCNTYNMMRLTEHLFAWEHNSEYMDWYENALYNHILGQQDPDTGAKMYFVSLLQGHHRVYEVKDESWWCCTGTGMENPGRYTRCTYYEDGSDLYVNLYMPGEYTWESKGITFKVETNYPYSQNVKMTVLSGSGDANVKLRAPAWLESAMTAKVGDDTYTSDGGEYMSVSRTWAEGDVIDITIPMQVRTYESRIEGQIAYQYGPIVLAAECGSLDGVNGVSEYISNETKIDSVTAKVPYIMTEAEDPAEIVTLLDASKLEFTISGDNISDGSDITLKPFHEIHHTFHNVYWNLNTETGKYDKKLNDVTVDRVEPDGQQDEIGHGLTSTTSQKNSHQGTHSIGANMYYWRDAFGSADAYFQYTMTVDGDNQNYLFVRYFGDDTGFSQNSVSYTRDFNIYVDGVKVAEQKLEREKPGSVYDVVYVIPAEYTNGKETVAVKFAPKSATTCAGGVVEVRVLAEDITKDASWTFETELTGNKLKYTSEYNTSYGYDMYVALYNADDEIIALKKNSANSEFTLDTAGEYTVKAFFWSEDGVKPVYEMQEVAVKYEIE